MSLRESARTGRTGTATVPNRARSAGRRATTGTGKGSARAVPRYRVRGTSSVRHGREYRGTGTPLAAERAAAQTELERTDFKVSILLAVAATALLGEAAVLLRTPPALAGIAIIAWLATTSCTVAAVFLLLRAVRPSNGGSHRLARWAHGNFRRLTRSEAEAELQWTASTARRRYQGQIGIAVDLLQATLVGAIITAAIVAATR